MKQFAGRVLGLAASVGAVRRARIPSLVCDTGPWLPSFNHAETVDFDRDGQLDVIASIGIRGVWVLRDNGLHERLHVFLGK
ncbi:MAG: hypothetical protein JNN27_12155 [Planctomycetes bacterium]|nr:hypothetical protein [Planctomycetota bacterium]